MNVRLECVPREPKRNPKPARTSVSSTAPRKGVASAMTAGTLAGRGRRAFADFSSRVVARRCVGQIDIGRFAKGRVPCGEYRAERGHDLLRVHSVNWESRDGSESAAVLVFPIFAAWTALTSRDV